MQQEKIDTGTVIEVNHQLRQKLCDNGLLTIEQWLLLLITTSSLIVNLLNRVDLKNIPGADKLGSISPLQIERSKKIKSILQDIATITECDRVLIGRFKNSTSWGDDHYLQMDVTDEYCDGAKSIKDDMQGINVTKLYSQIESYKTGEFLYINRNNPNIPEACVQYLDRHKVEFVISRSIEVRREKVGIFECHYCRPVDPNFKLEESRRSQLDRSFHQLQGIIQDIVTKKRKKGWLF